MPNAATAAPTGSSQRAGGQPEVTGAEWLDGAASPAAPAAPAAAADAGTAGGGTGAGGVRAACWASTSWRSAAIPDSRVAVSIVPTRPAYRPPVRSASRRRERSISL